MATRGMASCNTDTPAIAYAVVAGCSIITLHDPIDITARDQASSVLAAVLFAAYPVTIDVSCVDVRNPVAVSFVNATRYACDEAGIPVTIVTENQPELPSPLVAA
ncbi:hypothetical protein [Jonesia quinghaiensis]|uniref:hypothetical protein n=1 Tax=Jonesia quinghaiensis TaxID=262806 RepID=UPI00048E2981|nr:hypothetical protein [Jonesia quinghaiensis]